MIFSPPNFLLSAPPLCVKVALFFLTKYLSTCCQVSGELPCHNFKICLFFFLSKHKYSFLYICMLSSFTFHGSLFFIYLMIKFKHSNTKETRIELDSPCTTSCGVSYYFVPFIKIKPQTSTLA